MKNILLILLFCSPLLVYSQFDYNSYQFRMYLNNNSIGTFMVYDTTKSIVKMVKSEKEVDWTDIGNVAMSKIYANTPEWTLNTYEDTTGVLEDSTHYALVQQESTKNEYIRPICTYFYTVEREEAAILFFTWRTKQGDAEIPLTMAAVKKNGRWYAISDRKVIFGIKETVFAYREQVLAYVFAGKETENDRLNKFMHKVRIDNILDFEKLFEQLVLMKEADDKSDYKYLTRAGRSNEFPDFKPMRDNSFTSKVVQPMEIPNLRIHTYKSYDFFVDNTTRKQWVSELALIKSVQKSEIDTLRFEYRYTFQWDGHPFSIIKYKVSNTQKATILEQLDGEWKITEHPRFENLRYFMQVVKKEHFTDFGDIFMIDRNPIFKKYAPLYKQVLHSENIDKLANLLKTKPKELEPYCVFE